MLQCGVHTDQNPSVSVTQIETQALIYCHAGCDTTDVLAAYGLEMADLFDDSSNGATYRYPDGRQVYRTTDKRFWQKGNTKGRTLFRADLVGDAATVYVVEGEKDALAVESLGGVAVCSAMGAGKAAQFDWQPLHGKNVVVVADKDAPGRAHAAQVAKLLDGIAASVDIVEAAAGKDAADHIAAGKTLDELVKLKPQPPVNGTGPLADDAPDSDGPKLWNANDLAPAEQPRWLAANRLPRAALSLLIGEEGIGKSLLWVLVVAHITTGRALPGFGIPARQRGHVIIVITEDDWSTVVRPRLEVAGADLDMIRVICIEKDGSGSPIFPRDMPLIRNANPKPDLVVVDCWLDTVPASLSVRDSQQARLALHPWKDIATNTDAAIWLLGHSNRIATGSVRDRYGATYVLRQKARMTIWAMQDDDGALLVGPEKANGAVTTVASRFTTRPIQKFDATPEHDGTVPLLEYDHLSDMTIREHVDSAAAQQSATTGRGADASDATVWLTTHLAAGPRWSTDIESLAKADAIGVKRLRAAKFKCKVQSAREGGTGPWYMFLPQHSGKVPGSQMPPTCPSDAPYRERGTSGTCGENQMYPLSSQDVQMYPKEVYGTPGKGLHLCACGAQLTIPASIRYGACEECRLTASNDDSSPPTPTTERNSA
jgi:5S rRNA maturation endonuclease (ribonuclease M5)